ncbi:phosphoglucomutase/phosphomannomutase family protein [bacterium]|nr:MAG: phosphoglucomutase/phosphomannomutase family protein [bacterium]
MPLDIRFGTDGWRAHIARDYTFDNVEALTNALAAYLHKFQKEKAKNGVAIGYDTRFLSAEFARATAETLAQNGIPVFLADRDSPTPAIAWATRSKGLATGIMITASHNPPEWNGYKFFNPLGGPADRDMTNAVEAVIGRKFNHKLPVAPITVFDPRPALVAQLKTVIDFEVLKKAKGTAVYDAVHGTGRGYVDGILKECGWKVTSIHSDPDPMFGHISPDPADPECHKFLQETVLKKKADIGLANDPDADRFGIVDSKGLYLTPNQVLALAYHHLLEVRGLRGPVARSVATTGLLDAIAAAYDQQVIETPVGFKWLGSAIEEKGALLGGEESGGLSIIGHYGGKDGVLADLLLAEIWATHRKPLSDVYKGLSRKFGAFHSTRIDLHLSDDAKKKLMSRLKDHAPKQVAGSKVTDVITLDGVKLKLEDGSWLLLRPSGTEPLVRVYLEAGSAKRLKELQKSAETL